ncbi:MAG: nicotinate (nicotinamide) nucleotide adenylyltransferase [Candidatus Levybacteria bacterium]|nr:nicotinate (nicotinamide) nucleotide adenylyltransferase [Candidatus Levybacteria bacterium]
MKIAILGGSFDPPHLGHLFIALQVRELLQMDEVWLMPAYHHPFQRDLSDVAHRMAMTKLLQTETMKISDYEIKHNPTSYTIDTLNGLKESHPNNEFFWITGSDQLQHFQKYKQWQDIISKHNLIIFPREWMLPQLAEEVKNKLVLKTIPQNVIVLSEKNLILTNISSTKIRERVKANLSIQPFVSEQVAEYIKKEKLYI